MFFLNSILRFKCWSVFVCSLLCVLPGIAQTVENKRIDFDQSRQVMLIHFDVEGLNYKKAVKVTPHIKSGERLLPTTRGLSGDTAWLNRGGQHKLMVWDPFKDGVDSLKDIRVDFELAVKEVASPRFWGIAFQGSNSAPFGFKAMQLGRLGFYASVRSSGQAPPSGYTVSDAGAIDYKESGVYVITNKKRLASATFVGGPVLQVARKIYVYVGGGYGTEQLFWGYEAYNLDKNLTGSFWALNESINRKGVVIDAGATLRVGRLLFDLGMSSIQFDAFQITGGIGFTLAKMPALGADRSKLRVKHPVPLF